MKPVPCLCCGEPMSVGCDIRGKPYAMCDACGAQTFIRGARGIRLFSKQFGDEWTALPKGATLDSGDPNAAPREKPTPAAPPTPAPATPPTGGPRGPLEF